MMGGHVINQGFLHYKLQMSGKVEDELLSGGLAHAISLLFLYIFSFNLPTFR